jgi:hypothetical protein
MTGITLNMQALFVQKRNRAFLLVDQLVAVEEMFVLNPFNNLGQLFLRIFVSLFILSMQGMDTTDARLGALRSPASILQSPGRLPPRGPHMNCMIFFLYTCSFQLTRLILPKYVTADYSII